MAEHNRPLTKRQENFALEYVKHGIGAEAYRFAYKTDGMTDKTVWEAASRVLKNSKVAARIAELKQLAQERSLISVEEHLTIMNTMREAALRDKNYAAAVKAEENRGKVLGFYVQRIEQGQREVDLSAIIDALCQGNEELRKQLQALIPDPQGYAERALPPDGENKLTH